MLRTFVIVLLGYYFDIAENLTAAMQMLIRSVADFHLSQLAPSAILQALDLSKYDWFALLLGTVTVFVASVIQERRQTPIRELLDEARLPLRWCVLLAGIFSVVLLGTYGPGLNTADFVYMQF